MCIRISGVDRSETLKISAGRSFVKFAKAAVRIFRFGSGRIAGTAGRRRNSDYVVHIKRKDVKFRTYILPHRRSPPFSHSHSPKLTNLLYQKKKECQYLSFIFRMVFVIIPIPEFPRRTSEKFLQKSVFSHAYTTEVLKYPAECGIMIFGQISVCRCAQRADHDVPLPLLENGKRLGM